MKFKYSKFFFFSSRCGAGTGKVARKIFQYFSFHMIEEIEAKGNFNFITYYQVGTYVVTQFKAFIDDEGGANGMEPKQQQ